MVIRILILFIAVSVSLSAQINTFVRLSVQPKEVKLKQPMQLNIAVFTETWYTRAPNLDNIVVPGALAIKMDRAQGRYETIDNIRYTVLEFEFLLFPVEEGELIIPEISMNYATPESGDYKGKDVERKTRSRKVRVLPPDENFRFGNWLVADRLSVEEKWSKKPVDLKVGDVIERTIRISAEGTIASLIPASDTLSVSWGSVYSKTPELKTEIISGKLRSQRIERYSILLQKPGKQMIPEVLYSWWNPSTRKIGIRKLPPREIIIDDNPDLAILSSIRDSLEAMNNAEQETEDKTITFELLGMKPWQFLIVVLVTIFLLLQLKKFVLYHLMWRERREVYLKSEVYKFKLLEQACLGNDLYLIRNSLSNWINKIKKNTGIGSVSGYIAVYGDNQLSDLFNELEEKLFADKNNRDGFNGHIFRESLIRSRNKYLNRTDVDIEQDDYKYRLNP
jgi:hypothetical protein